MRLEVVARRGSDRDTSEIERYEVCVRLGRARVSVRHASPNRYARADNNQNYPELSRFMSML